MAKIKRRVLASTHPSSKVGQDRLAIYGAVWGRINHAKNNRCWLEVTALVESVIADRLEARVAHINCQQQEFRAARTAAQSAHLLLKTVDGGNQDARELYEKVIKWSLGRNSTIHELAKLLEGDDASWEGRYEAASKTANVGEKLARSVSALVKKLNKPNILKKK